MNVRKLLNSSSKTNLYELMEQWSPITVACGILLVLVTTLFPFNFAFPDDFALQKIVSSFQNQSNLSDWLGNVLLFIPFGFG
ncbi:MAG: VanZ family protein, partial [Symploca sp. SIO1A3]|nr:VanZ family protein [Symploca sp. SIO1A3]